VEFGKRRHIWTIRSFVSRKLSYLHQDIYKPIANINLVSLEQLCLGFPKVKHSAKICDGELDILYSADRICVEKPW
jgi:hypothetical protein